MNDGGHSSGKNPTWSQSAEHSMNSSPLSRHHSSHTSRFPSSFAASILHLSALLATQSAIEGSTEERNPSQALRKEKLSSSEMSNTSTTACRRPMAEAISRHLSGCRSKKWQEIARNSGADPENDTEQRGTASFIATNNHLAKRCFNSLCLERGRLGHHFRNDLGLEVLCLQLPKVGRCGDDCGKGVTPLPQHPPRKSPLAHAFAPAENEKGVAGHPSFTRSRTPSQS